MRKLTTKMAVIALALISTIAAIFWGLNTSSDQDAHASGGDASLLGLQRRLALRLDASLQQPGRTEPVSVTVEGDWVTTIAAVRAGERDVACELAGARISGAGVASATPEQAAELAKRLSRRFWVTWRDDGTALRLHFPREVGPGDRNLLHMIVTETALVRPAAAKDHWTATERDGAGMYFAVYQRSPGSIVKRKLKYLDANDTGAPSLAVDSVDAEWNYELDPAGEVTGLKGHDRMRISAPMAPPSAQGAGTASLVMSADVSLSNARKGKAPELVGSLVRAAAAVEVVAIGTQQIDLDQATASRDRELLEGRSNDSLLAAAQAGDKSDPFLASRLAAMFRRRPESIPAGAELVRKNGGLPKVTEALGVAGTAPALNALGALIKESASPRQARVDSLNALLRVPRPGPAELAIARNVLDDADPQVRRAARMVLGGLAFSVSDSESHAAVERELLSRYPRASASERADIIDGIGNSAGPLALDAVKDALRDDAVEVRMAAARALRRLDTPDADKLLASVISGDKDDRVRNTALRAAETRWPQRGDNSFRPATDALVASILAASTQDPSETVRAGAVGLLRMHLETGSEVHDALTRVATNDARPGVRRLAAEALAQNAPPQSP